MEKHWDGNIWLVETTILAQILLGTQTCTYGFNLGINQCMDMARWPLTSIGYEPYDQHLATFYDVIDTWQILHNRLAICGLLIMRISCMITRVHCPHFKRGEAMIFFWLQLLVLRLVVYHRCLRATSKNGHDAMPHPLRMGSVSTTQWGIDKNADLPQWAWQHDRMADVWLGSCEHAGAQLEAECGKSRTYDPGAPHLHLVHPPPM